jgi:tetratricopeptide (TPR) repeat protein
MFNPFKGKKEPEITKKSEIKQIVTPDSRTLVDKKTGRSVRPDQVIDDMVKDQKPSAATLHNWGATFIKEGLYELALECFNRYLTEHPGDSEALYNKGTVFWKLSLKDESLKVEALECFEAALNNNPNLAIAWLYKGSCLESLGRANEAQASFARAFELEPDLAKRFS